MPSGGTPVVAPGTTGKGKPPKDDDIMREMGDCLDRCKCSNAQTAVNWRPIVPDEHESVKPSSPKQNKDLTGPILISVTQKLPRHSTPHEVISKLVVTDAYNSPPDIICSLTKAFLSEAFLRPLSLYD